MPAERKKLLRTFAEIQRAAASLVAEVNAQPDIARGAAANPIFALQDLGYELSPEASADLQDRARFGPKKTQQLKVLRARVFELAGHPFDLQSDDELRRVLVDELKIPLPQRAYHKQVQSPLAGTLTLPPQVPWAPKVADPLEEIRNVHPILAPLLDYRHLEASEPRLASREVYDAVRQGSRRTPLKTIRGVLKARSR